MVAQSEQESLLTPQGFLAEFRQMLGKYRSLGKAVKCKQWVEKFKNVEDFFREDGAAEWTNALINIVLDIGREKCGQIYEVFPTQLYFYRDLKEGKTGKHKDDWDKGGNGIYYKDKTNKSHGEHLLDVVWIEKSKLPQDEQGHRYKYQGELVLGCECEWGWKWDMKKGSNEVYLEDFSDDFMKLVHVQARLKVMFFTYGAEKKQGNLRSILDLAAELARDDENGQYLLIGLPWNTAWKQQENGNDYRLCYQAWGLHATSKDKRVYPMALAQ